MSIGDLIGNFIPSRIGKLFTPSSGSKEDHLYVFEQQSGCGAKIYHQDGRTTNLFFEIVACSLDRSINEFGGSFTMTLVPSEPWDEIIEPDDYIRIFMGDQLVSEANPGAYNFATGLVNQQSDYTDNKGSTVYVPLNIGGWDFNQTSSRVQYKEKYSIPYLVMFERFLGKIDRCERVESPGSNNTGPQVSFSVSGRSFGSIIDDVSIYYNEFIPGLNAYNLFGTEFGKFGNVSATAFVKELLVLTLSGLPLPQFQLPDELLKDLDFPAVKNANQDLAAEALKTFQDIISKQPNADIPGYDGLITELRRIADVVSNKRDGNNTPFQILSLLGLEETEGKTTNVNVLNSATKGFSDMLKGICNPKFNELFFDMTPAGQNTGSLLYSRGIPSVVMRQRPYNITEDMLENLIGLYDKYTNKYDQFKDPQSAYSQDLTKMMASGIDIFGSMKNPNLKATIEGLSAFPGFLKSAANFAPSAMEYQVGISGHDRLNVFNVQPEGNNDGDAYYRRSLSATNQVYKFFTDSIVKHGLKIMEASSQYCFYPNEKNSSFDPWVAAKTFSDLLTNWYTLNPAFYNGRIVSRFMPEARLGVPLRYYETTITTYNPYPRCELFYVQGVTDTFSLGQPLKTTFTVTRGLRYRLNEKQAVTSDILSIRNRAVAYGSSIGAIIS